MANNALIGCLQASQYLGVSVKTVRRWAQSGQLRGSKVGSRGDWRFSYEDLDNLIHRTSLEPYKDIVQFLQKNALKISLDASEKHKKELRLSDHRFQKVQKTMHLSNDIVKLLADNLNDVNTGKRTFEQLSIKIAEESLKNGLTIEETIDGPMFLKQSIIHFLDESKLLLKLNSQELFSLMRSISLFNDIVASQIAFAFHYKFAKSQESLRQSEEKFAKVFELGPVAYTITRFSTGKIINVNEKFIQLTGYSKQELIGKDSLKAGFFSDAESKKAYHTRRQLIASTGYISKYSVALKTKKGAIKRVNCSSVIVKIDGDDHTVTFYQDAEEALKTKKQKDEYRELSLAHETLMKVSEVKDQFIGIASHQLRTPATTVKQYIGMILADMVGTITDEQRRFLETAYNSNERQLKLINGLLKTAQIDASTYRLQKNKYTIATLLKSVIEAYSANLKNRNQIVIFNDKSNDVQANVDPMEMDLVFSNLIENASKYSQDGSKIFVNITAKYMKKKYVEIEVLDEGVGIEASNHIKVFDKFTRISNQMSTPDNGTGLGLYWVKKIVEMHDGKVFVESKPGEGSAFKVRLPI